MDAFEFAAKWKSSTLSERSASQSHFLDLCALLRVAAPTDLDTDGESYCFEKGAVKTTGGQGWADVWKKDCFGWEYKGKHKDLVAAYAQLQQYAPKLDNPRLLIVSDMETIKVHTNFEACVTKVLVFTLEDLKDPAKRETLSYAFTNPKKLRPGQTRNDLTETVAGEFARLAKSLQTRGYDPDAVAHFVNRLVFCMFAEDVDLLPNKLFRRMIEAAINRPLSFTNMAKQLFGAMRTGGEWGPDHIKWFSGGLFDSDEVIQLELAELKTVMRAAEQDWSQIEPTILGTLFERGLDPDKRGQLGAHYTNVQTIKKLVDPVVSIPLRKEWAGILSQAQVKLAGIKPSNRSKVRNDVQKMCGDFLERLKGFRVLDPACGSGNFLYIALIALKDLEHSVNLDIFELGLSRRLPAVGPEAVLGIEINPYAAELARVSVWIGEIQWMRAHGYQATDKPVLRQLDNIECKDALITADSTIAVWPASDAIVGNPPFLGNKSMIAALGEDYTTRVRAAFQPFLSSQVDFVCYWFERARTETTSGRTKHVGLVSTQSIRKGASRAVLDRIREHATIYEAWSNEEWTVDGADVRVSLICFAPKYSGDFQLDGKAVVAIHADLSAGAADLTTARRLIANLKLSFQGPVVIGRFDIPGETARVWLKSANNANGAGNSFVLRPYVNGQDLMKKRSPDIWLIDFAEMDEREAAWYTLPYAHTMRVVKPQRDKNRRPRRRIKWWQHGETVPGWRAAVGHLERYIATPRVSRHRVFLWLDATVMPDSRLYAIARDDDTAFGILHSRFHVAWALAHASRHGIGNDPTYNNQTCFETFPFPDGLTLDLPPQEYVAKEHAKSIAGAAIALVEARDRWMNPSELVRTMPEVVPGFPDRVVPNDDAASAALKGRTFTNLYNMRGTPEGAWLDNLHEVLDAAVATAYGWAAVISIDDALSRLLALNLQRASRV